MISTEKAKQNVVSDAITVANAIGGDWVIGVRAPDGVTVLITSLSLLDPTKSFRHSRAFCSIVHAHLIGPTQVGQFWMHVNA
ncbi:protein of unknown function (plasmid) [Pararobbsia alpina]